MSKVENPNPVIFNGDKKAHDSDKLRLEAELNPEIDDEIDNYEVFDLIRNVNDPEHPLTLE